MWSLFKKKEKKEEDKDYMTEGLSEGIFDYSSEELTPLVFSNGKTQADIVKEILDEIGKGNKIIFIKGVCGTGKSAIALNLARHFKKSAIVVPIKSLQEQYEQDYTKKNFILKKDKSKLKISMIKGRGNFSCPFMDEKADNEDLPCTIEIREKNMDRIMKYIGMNSNVSKLDFTSVSDVKRMSIAPACPYWSPLLPSDINAKALEKAKKKNYVALSGIDYSLYQRKKGCGYYDQYEAYSDSDVLIFNSLKYIIESYLGRKPRTDIDIIDECDEFLDNFANEKSINLNRLVIALSNLNPERREKDKIKELILDLNEIILNYTEGIERIEKTPFLEFIKKILKSPYIAEDEDENYYNKVFEIAMEYENFLDETYISFAKEKDSVYANLVTINLAKRFSNLIEQNKILVLMSGTLHSEQVLKDIFGLDKFKVIEAETIPPGTITKFRTGQERNFKYENFKLGNVSRKEYLYALSACVEHAKLPALVHVNAFEDLPNEFEKAEFDLKNLVTREQLKTKNQEKEIEKFKSGEIDTLFTTKCSRGVDFPGEKCNSIILTKYPYPNIQSLFWRILRQEKPEKFMEFYLDKARRELLQKIYRGLRFKEDHIIVLSPDVRVLNENLR